MALSAETTGGDDADLDSAHIGSRPGDAPADEEWPWTPFQSFTLAAAVFVGTSALTVLVRCLSYHYIAYELASDRARRQRVLYGHHDPFWDGYDNPDEREAVHRVELDAAMYEAGGAAAPAQGVVGRLRAEVDRRRDEARRAELEREMAALRADAGRMARDLEAAAHRGGGMGGEAAAESEAALRDALKDLRERTKAAEDGFVEAAKKRAERRDRAAKARNERKETDAARAANAKAAKAAENAAEEEAKARVRMMALSDDTLRHVTVHSWLAMVAGIEDAMGAGQFPDHPVARGSGGAGYHGNLGGRPVFVKVLSARALGDEGVLRRLFKAEVEALVRFRHAHVARILGIAVKPRAEAEAGAGAGADVHEDALEAAIVMERMTHGDLRGYLAANKTTLTAEARVRLLLDAAKGLAFLHHGGLRGRDPMAHRDVSSKNVGLTGAGTVTGTGTGTGTGTNTAVAVTAALTAGSGGAKPALVAKLLDFGTSHTLEGHDAHTLYRQAARAAGVGDLVMSPGYPAPELRTKAPWGLETDVFCFGVLVLEMTSGMPPVDDSGRELLTMIREHMASSGTRADRGRSRLSHRGRVVPAEYVDEGAEWHDDTLRSLSSLAFQCTRTTPSNRPTAARVVALLMLMLSGITARAAGGIKAKGSDSPLKRAQMMAEAVARQVVLLEGQRKSDRTLPTGAAASVVDIGSGVGGAGERKAGDGDEDDEVECEVCMDDFSPAEAATGVTCPDGHFVCRDCMSEHVRANLADAARLRASDFALCCANGDCPIELDDVTVLTGIDANAALAFQTFLLGMLRQVDAERDKLTHLARLEADRSAALGRVVAATLGKSATDIELEIAAEEARAKAAPDEALKLETHHAVARILTLACPRCGAAYLDYTGCAAVVCGASGCGCGFCAVCLEDCGGDAHAHLADTHKHPRTGGFTPWWTVEDVATEHIPRHTRMIRDFLATKPEHKRAALVEHVRGLIEPNIKAEDLL